jgi:DNA-binding transcriptional ArsR family regulator
MRGRPATPAEAKALAHPLRLRILRLCNDQALTNKQLAERLGKDPGTVLHHVRTLVETGFLAPGEVRQGERGTLEKPYRSTGKSWSLSLGDDPAMETSASQAMVEAFLAELEEAGPGAATGFTRLALTLDDDSLKELQSRAQALFDEFVDRPPDPDGQRYSLFLGMHRQPRADQPPGSGGVAPRS